MTISIATTQLPNSCSAPRFGARTESTAPRGIPSDTTYSTTHSLGRLDGLQLMFSSARSMAVRRAQSSSQLWIQLAPLIPYIYVYNVHLRNSSMIVPAIPRATHLRGALLMALDAPPGSRCTDRTNLRCFCGSQLETCNHFLNDREELHREIASSSLRLSIALKADRHLMCELVH